ncbi:MAG: hypothetical protein HYZ34_06545 [Ignavibacteriae bacterium]|nr:hypothetical protein [Ignavibacteriota bacterium]
MKFSFSVPSDFNLKSTVHSHGWSDLLPFEVFDDGNQLQRNFELTSGKILNASIGHQNNKVQSTKYQVQITVNTNQKIILSERKELTNQITSCLRLDDDYSDFYKEVKKYKEFHWVLKYGAGRLMRAPTVWEDVVKMLCTTNCSWTLTTMMVKNLCEILGTEVSGLPPTTRTVSCYSFPKPEAIADCSEKYLRKEIRVGYRAPYLLELAQRVIKKEVDLESWRSTHLSTQELFDEVHSVKGIGPYAAGNILKLLGHYDYLAIDSWCNKQFFEKHRNGRRVTDKTIEKFYKPFGKWRGLFFWLDVTERWYKTERIF